MKSTSHTLLWGPATRPAVARCRFNISAGRLSLQSASSDTTGRRSSSSSNSSSSSPSEIAERFLRKFQSCPPEVKTQLLDANQLQLFSLTLNRPNLWPGMSVLDAPPKNGTPLPPYYHYAYFTVPILESELGLDGSDKSYNPDSPFTRRMWAGGSVHWPGATTGNVLRVGETATETTRVISCEAKTAKKTNEPMLVVLVEKELSNATGQVAVRDRRSWVFRPALDPNHLPRTTPTPRPPRLPDSELPHSTELGGNGQDGRGARVVRPFTQSALTLFRFSALTFNGHKIHYSLPWCQGVEGHRNIVVHGPMNLIHMLDLWRDCRSGPGSSAPPATAEEYLFPESIEYRATNPVYADEPYRVVLDASSTGEGEMDVEVKSDDGRSCMWGKIRRR